MSTALQAILFGVLLPATIAGVFLLVGRRAWAAALGIGVGYAAGHAALEGEWPSLPPHDVTNWPIYFAIGAAILAVVETAWEYRAAVRWLVRVAVACGILWLLKPHDEDWRWLGAFFVAMMSFWILLALLARRLGDATLLLVLIVTVSGASVLFAVTGSVSLAQMGGCLAAGLGASWLLSAIGVGRAIVGGVVPVVAIVFSSIAACSVARWSYSSTPWWMAAVVAASPSAAWLVDWTPLRSATPWKSAVARATVVAIVVAVPVGLALKDFLASPY